MRVPLPLLVLTGVSMIKFASADSDMTEFECKGKKIPISDKHQADTKACLTSVGITSVYELNMDTLGCFSRCSMMQQGLFDEGGKPHKEKIMNMIDEHIPDLLKTEWKGSLEKCLDNGGDQIDIKDDKSPCQSFVPLTMCCNQAFIEICM